MRERIIGLRKRRDRHQRGKRVLWAVLLAAAVILAGGGRPCQAGQNLVFIVDASASMAGPLAGGTKMAAVREVLLDGVKRVAGDTDVGLLVFGSRRKGDCDDVRIAVPVGDPDISRFARSLSTLSPTGMTPMAAALDLLRSRLKHFRDPTTAIVVADGQETCLGDPCEEARRLKRIYRDLVIHVIGLDVPLSEETSLVCISGNTGGRYHRVTNRAELETALSKAVAAEGMIPSPVDTAEAPESAEAGETPAQERTGPAMEPEPPGPAAPAPAPRKPMIKRKVPVKRFQGPPAEPVRKIRVRVRRGRVRAGPSLSSKIRFRVDRGTPLSLLGVRGDWNHVMDDQGRSGWAHYSLFFPRLKPERRHPRAVPRLLEIRVDEGDGATRVAFDLTRPLRPEVTFMSRPAPTVICRFPDARAGSGLSAGLPETPAGQIRQVTLDPDHPAGLRVKMALQPGRSYRLQHFFSGTTPGYRMIIRPVGNPGPADAETDQ